MHIHGPSARLGKKTKPESWDLVSRVVKTDVKASPLKELSSALLRSRELSADGISGRQSGRCRAVGSRLGRFPGRLVLSACV